MVFAAIPAIAFAQDDEEATCDQMPATEEQLEQGQDETVAVDQTSATEEQLEQPETTVSNQTPATEEQQEQQIQLQSEKLTPVNTGIGKYRLNTTAMKSAVKKYEKKRPSIKNKTGRTFKMISPITKPRYRLYSDGIYHSGSVERDGVATIMFTGDNMCIAAQQRKAMKRHGKYNFRESYKYAKRQFRNADFVVGNLETNLADDMALISEQSKTDEHTNCNAPSTFLDALRYAGYDLLVNSNNHNVDTGVKGIFETNARLDQYGLIHTGLFTSAKEQRFVIAKIDGIKVAFLSYSRFFNYRDKNLTSEGKKVLLNKYSAAAVTRDVTAAKAAGAEYVIACMHWGVEGEHDITEGQQTQAQEVADAGVDYIIGSHPHVIQPYKVVTASDGRLVPVVFSMGNFVSSFGFTRFKGTRDSMILKIRLKKNKAGKVVLLDDSYVPVYVFNKYQDCIYCAAPLTKGNLQPDYKETFYKKYAFIKKCVGSNLKIYSPLQ